MADEVQRTLDTVDLLHAHMAVCMICRNSRAFCDEGDALRKSIDAAARRARAVVADERRPRGSE